MSIYRQRPSAHTPHAPRSPASTIPQPSLRLLPSLLWLLHSPVSLHGPSQATLDEKLLRCFSFSASTPLTSSHHFPGGTDGKQSACIARDQSLIPGSGRSPEEGNGNPLQYSLLENSMDRGTWQATVHGVVKNRTGLSD